MKTSTLIIGGIAIIALFLVIRNTTQAATTMTNPANQGTTSGSATTVGNSVATGLQGFFGNLFGGGGSSGSW